MPRTAVPPVNIVDEVVINITDALTVADTTNLNMWDFVAGQIVIVANNGGGSFNASLVATIAGATLTKTFTTASGKYYAVRLRLPQWADHGGDDPGKVYFDAGNSAVRVTVLNP